MPGTPQCLADEIVVALASGQRVADPETEQHLAGCTTCCEAIAATARLLEEAEPRATATSATTVSDRGPHVPARDLDRGTRVGRYEILGILGRGGMGIVYEAHDPGLHRRVALKLLRPDVDSREQQQERLLREARAMAKLSSPHVVAVHDVGTFEDQVFVAMELVDGSTLRGWLREVDRRPWRDVVGHFMEAGRGLAAAHAATIVHRDFKPENVIIGRDGRVRVTDFGLARSAAVEPPMTPGRMVGDLGTLDSLTQTGLLAGTPAYMSPEQMLGRGLDPQTDQFSFCVALYEALYGRRPFTSSTGDARLDAIEAGPPRPPRRRDVPDALYAILARGLRVHPDGRYPSMDALLDALRAVADEPSKPRRRGRMVAAALMLTASGLVAMVARPWGHHEPTRPASAPAPAATTAVSEPQPSVEVPAATSAPTVAPAVVPDVAASPPVAHAKRHVKPAPRPTVKPTAGPKSTTTRLGNGLDPPDFGKPR